MNRAGLKKVKKVVRGDRSEDLDYAAHHAREQSAERSGHFSTRYPGYKGKIPRLRLEAGRS